MEKIDTAFVERLITDRYRLEDPDIKRIGVERGPEGWRCHRLWLQVDVAPLPKGEAEAILSDANEMLTGILQKYETEDDDEVGDAKASA